LNQRGESVRDTQMCYSAVITQENYNSWSRVSFKGEQYNFDVITESFLFLD